MLFLLFLLLLLLLLFLLVAATAVVFAIFDVAAVFDAFELEAVVVDFLLLPSVLMLLSLSMLSITQMMQNLFANN